MTLSQYGDMGKFIEKLKAADYEKIELIDTTNGMFMGLNEAKRLYLSGSKLLIGKK